MWIILVHTTLVTLALSYAVDSGKERDIWPRTRIQSAPAPTPRGCIWLRRNHLLPTVRFCMAHALIPPAPTMLSARNPHSTASALFQMAVLQLSIMAITPSREVLTSA